ncbi:NAD(P)-dependent oxidoreductase [Patescibacteria group bacterium]
MGMKKHKIVVATPMNFLPEQEDRLRSLGDVKIYNTLPDSPDDWLKRCKRADIICSGKYGLKEKMYQLNNVLFSLPFVAVGWLDKKKLKKKNITVSYCPGCNRHAVSEWVIAMMFLLLRKFNKLIGTTHLKGKMGSKDYLGLAGKKVCILGKGNIGARVYEVCKALEMDIDHFGKGDDLTKKVKNVDVVVNTLSYNSSTEGMLDKNFFNSLRKSTFFITVTSNKIYDSKAVFDALDKGILDGFADDCGSILPGEYTDPYYKKLTKHPKVLTTPHISYQSDVTVKMSNDMMIDNVEAYIKDKPINIVN